jgi:hypothetical protein
MAVRKTIARFLNEEGVTLASGVPTTVDRHPGSITMCGLEVPEGSALRVAMQDVGSIANRPALQPASGAAG